MTTTQLTPAHQAEGTGYWPFETRADLARDLVESYEAGASIRELSKARHICFGTVRRLLWEGGAVMRPRGDTRRPNRD